MDSNKKNSFEMFFVEKLIKDISNGTSLAAKLKRADNDTTAYNAWEYLVRCGIDIEDKSKRQVFCLIAASMAKNKVSKNGNQNIGRVMSSLYEKNSEGESPADKYIMRLLSCDSPEDVCNILRPILSLIGSKGMAEQIDYANLIKDILFIRTDNVKVRWAKGFYNKVRENNDENVSDNA